MTMHHPAVLGVADTDLAEVWQALAEAAPRGAQPRPAVEEMDGLAWRHARLSAIAA